MPLPGLPSHDFAAIRPPFEEGASAAARGGRGVVDFLAGLTEPFCLAGVLQGEERRVDSDEVLLERVRGGDIGAFDVLYERHEARLFAYLRVMLGDRGDAEEVLHDAFLTALKDRSATLDRDGAFRAWLYRVARNIALNRRRASGRYDKQVASFSREDGADVEERVAPPEHRADRLLEARQLEDALVSAIARLPASLGELWHLRTSGLSYEQIADVVGAPLGTVKSRMHQMVSVLREELKPWIAPQ